MAKQGVFRLFTAKTLLEIGRHEHVAVVRRFGAPNTRQLQQRPWADLPTQKCPDASRSQLHIWIPCVGNGNRPLQRSGRSSSIAIRSRKSILVGMLLLLHDHLHWGLLAIKVSISSMTITRGARQRLCN